MTETVKYVGLDVHKNTIAVAVAEDGKRGEVREHGEIANTPAVLTKLLGKLGGLAIVTAPRDRLSRDPVDLYSILKRLADFGIAVRFLREGDDFFARGTIS